MNDVKRTSVRIAVVVAALLCAKIPVNANSGFYPCASHDYEEVLSASAWAQVLRVTKGRHKILVDVVQNSKLYDFVGMSAFRKTCGADLVITASPGVEHGVSLSGERWRVTRLPRIVVQLPISTPRNDRWTRAVSIAIDESIRRHGFERGFTQGVQAIVDEYNVNVGQATIDLPLPSEH